MLTIYFLLFAIVAVFFVIIVYKAILKKNIINSLYIIFRAGYWFLILFLIFQISIEVFTENGTINLDDNSRIFSSGHSSKGYNVPVTIMISFDEKKIYNYNKKDTITGNTFSGTFYKFSNEQKNNSIKKNLLREAGITKQQLDSIFKFSSAIEIQGNKLKISGESGLNKTLKTNTSSFNTNGYLNIKSSNWFFVFCQFVGNYLKILVLIVIFYQMQSIFKNLKKEFKFSKALSKKMKWVGFLLVGQQLLTFTLSIIYGIYYNYVGFENPNNDIQLSINPRLEFDFTFFIIGLGLIVLSTLLEKGGEIQQENDLTI